MKIRKYFETNGNKLPHVKFLEKEIFSLEKIFKMTKLSLNLQKKKISKMSPKKVKQQRKMLKVRVEIDFK